LDESCGGGRNGQHGQSFLYVIGKQNKENKTFLDYVVQKRNPDEKKFNNDVQDTHYQVKFGYRTG
jgi:hypothetical protein